MVDNSVINENMRDMATVGAPAGITIFGYPLAESLPLLYFISVTCSIVWLIASFIYKVHSNRKQARAHELDIKERELRIKREEMEIARLTNG